MARKVASLLVAVGCSLLGAVVLLAVMIANAIDGGADPSNGESLGVLFLVVLGAALAWSAWIWLRQGYSRHALGGSLGAVAIVLGSGGVAALALQQDEPRPCDEVRADASDFVEARRGAELERPPTRAEKMADDLIRCRILDALPKRAVIRLLGRPDATNATERVDLHAPEFDYYLGSERGYFPIDSETLAVRFDEQDQVRAVSIHRD